MKRNTTATTKRLFSTIGDYIRHVRLDVCRRTSFRRQCLKEVFFILFNLNSVLFRWQFATKGLRQATLPEQN